MKLYEAFHLAQSSECKLKGVWGLELKPYENGPQQRFFVIIFNIYYAALKIVAYLMSYTDMHDL